MLRVEQLGQPGQGQAVDLLRDAVHDSRYRSLSAPVAYVVDSGISLLLKRCNAADIARLTKRWLVAIDWCRSSPTALDILDGLSNSSLRIVDGKRVVANSGCAPSRSFHPKGFLFSGPRARLLVSGSANVSRNGLSTGHELCTVIEVKDPSNAVELKAWGALGATGKWFDGLWKPAVVYPTIRSEYEAKYRRALKRPTPIVDDTASSSVGPGRTFGADDLVRLRAATCFWTATKGGVSKNLGAGRPGNQLNMSALTRVYFGMPAKDVPRDSHLGYITIRWGGQDFGQRSIRYSNNSMDVLTLPHPGTQGPPTYEDETLLFTRFADGTSIKYRLEVLTAAEAAAARKKSQAVDGLYAMRSLRKFGVY